MKKSIFKISLLLVCFFYVFSSVPQAAAQTDTTPTELSLLADQLTAECFTAHEPPNAVTRNLTLRLPDMMTSEGISAGYSSSDQSVLTVSGETGIVHRDRYASRDVVLTVALSRGTETVTKPLSLRVLSDSTVVYMSDSFYYPAYKGRLINEVTPIFDSYNHKKTETSSLYGGGWSMLYEASLSEADTTNVRRFKTLLSQEDNEFCLYSYRSEAFEEYNYTRYTFQTKPTGQIEMSMRLKFAEAEPYQIYLFQLYGNYLSPSGSLERAKPIEVQFHRRPNGKHHFTLNGKGIISEAVPATNEWFTCRFIVDLADQSYHFYINDTQINSEPVDFYDKGQANRTDCRSLNDFLFNSYRQHGGGAIFLDDMVVTNDTTYYEQNQHKLRLADDMQLSDIAFYSDNSPVVADCVTDSFSLSPTANSALAAQMAAHGLSVSWDSSDPVTLSIDNNTATLNRGALTKEVTLTAKIQQNQDGTYVEKAFVLTIPCVDEAKRLNTLYNDLRAEMLTTQAPKAITQNLQLPTYEGVTLTWQSNRPDVLTHEGVVIRPEQDTSVTITATLSENGYQLVKELDFCILAKGKAVYAAENFYHPSDLNAELSATTTIRGWSNTASSAGPRLTNTIIQEPDGNYIMKSQRTEANAKDMNFCRYHFQKQPENEADVSFKFKLEHESGSHVYILQLYGTRKKGSVTNSYIQIAEIQLYYTGTGGLILAMSPTEATSTKILTNEAPKTDRWYEARFVANNTAQAYDFYLNGEKLNAQPIAYYKADPTVDFIAVSDFVYNSYRYHGDSTIYTDEVCVISPEGLQLACMLYDNGVDKTDDPGRIVSGKMDAKVYAYNSQDIAVSGQIYLAAYQDGRLLYSHRAPSSLKAHASGEAARFTDLPLSHTDTVEIKVMLLDEKNLQPQAQCSVLTNRLATLQPQTITDSDTGRSYQMLNLFGQNSVKGYFTQQGWSADNSRFYFWDADMNIYEYDTQENRGRFIDRGLYSFNLCTTPLNHLFYINRDREIIQMDCTTHEKTVITTIPEAYCTDKANMIQVNNDESRLSVDWKDTGGTEENGPVIDPETETRFPVYDMTTDTWLLNRTYGFDSVEYAPNHLNLNPSPEKNNLVLFAHEGNYIKDRVWVMDLNTGLAYNAFQQKMYTDTDAGETAGHETWSYDGERILFCKNGKIGYKGLVTVRYDGTDRRYINSDYGYLHAGISPVTDRWIVSDTAYGVDKISKLVLIDSYTGDSYHLATVYQTGLDPGHCHPGFSLDGNTIWFGLYDENDVVSIGWMDVSDIINAAPTVQTYTLSSNCQIETAERAHEVQSTTAGGETGYFIPRDGVMRVQAQTTEYESCASDITIRYWDEGTADLCLDYYIRRRNEEGVYALTPMTQTISRTDTATWQEATLSLTDINLENMERLGADFILRGDESDATVQSVFVDVKSTD